MSRTLVTIGTDGCRDYVRLPDGTTFTLGSVSILKLVTELAPNSRSARQALDDFLENGESLLNINLAELDRLIVRPRVRWSSDKTSSHKNPSMNHQVFENQLAKVERHLNLLTAAETPSEVDTGHVFRLISCIQRLLDQKSSSLSAGELLTEQILRTVEAIASEVDKLETSGEPVDSSLVRLDLHRISSQVNLITAGNVGDSLAQLYALGQEVKNIQEYLVEC